MILEGCSRKTGLTVLFRTIGRGPPTAQSIAKQAGIKGCDQVLTGAELADMPDEELARRVRDSQIFARVVPEQKLQVVNALKANGEVVAMTGMA